jgi:hypothetical protein
MSASRAANERKRIRHAAVIAAKPDARFLVQLIAGEESQNTRADKKTAPFRGAAAYSLVMTSDTSARLDALDHAA